jgi:hypothetical protein
MAKVVLGGFKLVGNQSVTMWTSSLSDLSNGDHLSSEGIMDIFAALAEIEREKAIPERKIDFWSPEWRKVAEIVRGSEERVYKLKLSIAREFGIRHGWRLSTPFSHKCLARGGVHDREDGHGMPSKFVDHPQYYRVNRKAAAQLNHIYVPPFEEALFNRWALSNNLTLYLPDFPSWYNDQTRLVVYLGPVGGL